MTGEKKVKENYDSKDWQEYLAYIEKKYGKIPTITEYFKIADELKEWG